MIAPRHYDGSEHLHVRGDTVDLDSQPAEHDEHLLSGEIDGDPADLLRSDFGARSCEPALP